ncbi:MAG: molybdopterin-dependent oxidoreductase [Actinobacteria bacterium]|nr:molybdopterin-dependent oxidoreductase [Actinomycetota bacterium]
MLEDRGGHGTTDMPVSESSEKTIAKGLGFCGNGFDANSVFVDVKGGRIVRIRPLRYDEKYDRSYLNPWKMDARGKVFEPSMKSLRPPHSLAYKRRVYSPNRILYPLKRVDWDPDGERNPQNRGTSKYVRISWDEAIGILVHELTRVRETYGPSAILCQADGHGETKVVHGPHGCPRKLLSLLGGCTMQNRNADSWEGWVWGAKHVWGMEPIGLQTPTTNAFPDVAKHTDLILHWGCDLETTPWGWQGQMASRLSYWFSELGIKQIFVCPDVNYSAAVHADKWIPILPNTDAALHLAIAYTWLTEGTYDKEYVRTHVVGFDQFMAYVLGEEDGVPKTPQWASEKCGVPSRTIKALARYWATHTTSTAHGNGGSMIRGPYGTEPARLEVCLLGMQGLGKPGIHALRMIEWGIFNDPHVYPLPPGVVMPSVMAAHSGGYAVAFEGDAWDVAEREAEEQPGHAAPPEQFIPKNLVHEAILNPPLEWQGTTLLIEPVQDQFKKYHYPVEGCSEIHMIWTDTPSWTTCWNDGNSYARALRSPKIEFIVAQHPWLENDCTMADLILPSNTKMEEQDIAVDNFSGQFHTVMYEEQCIAPLGESMSDYEIVCKVAERLGLRREYTGNRSVQEWIDLGFHTSGVQDRISYEEFKSNGYYVVPTAEGWEEAPAGLFKFYEDPEANPLNTPSGKLEFSSDRLAHHFGDDLERPPLPHWIEGGPSHDERRSSERAAKFPLLIVSNHPRWRVHSQHDDISWFHEIRTSKVKGPDGYLYEPVWLHPTDAEPRGIGDGDIVKVFNERGGVLGGARVWERIVPGAAYMDHGSRYDPIVPGVLDRGGAINTVTPKSPMSKNATGMATSGYLVEVERVDIDALRAQYPEAFARPYDGASGLCMERVLAEEAV